MLGKPLTGSLLLIGLMLGWISAGIGSERLGGSPATANTHWSYSGEYGPENWAGLSKDYALCRAGKRQSPVNIDRARLVNLPPLVFRYRSSTLLIKHYDHTLWLSYDPGSYLRLDGEEYQLLGLDFHSPGEHAIDGEVGNMAIHFHHTNNRGDKLILEVPVVINRRSNSMLTKILEHTPLNSGQRSYRRNLGINAALLLPSDRHFYTYHGSLTAPPCTEGVQWIVFDHPIGISPVFVKQFRKVIGRNARPLQPLNDRMIRNSLH